MSGIVSKNGGRSSGIVGAGDVGADAVDGSNIADDAIDSEHYAAGSIDEAHIADDAVTLAKMAGGTDGQIITYDASGNPSAVGPGTDGQVLTSTGAGSPPAFEALAAGDNTPRFFVHTGDHNTTLTPGTWTKVTIMGSSVVDTDSAWSTTNDKYTIPSGEGGDYMFGANATFASTSNQLQGFRLGIYKNGSRVYSGYMTYFNDSTSKFRHGDAGVICMDSASATDYYEFYVLAYGHTDVQYMDDSENFRYTNFWGFKLA